MLSVLALHLLARIFIALFFYISVIIYDYIHRLVFVGFCDFQILIIDTSYYVATFVRLLFLQDLIISKTLDRVVFDADQHAIFAYWLDFRVNQGISVFVVLCK